MQIEGAQTADCRLQRRRLQTVGGTNSHTMWGIDVAVGIGMPNTGGGDICDPRQSARVNRMFFISEMFRRNRQNHLGFVLLLVGGGIITFIIMPYFTFFHKVNVQ